MTTPAQRQRIASLLGQNTDVLGDIGLRPDEVQDVMNRVTKATYNADATKVRREAGQALQGALPKTYEAIRLGIAPVTDEFGDVVAPGLDWKSIRSVMLNSMTQIDDQVKDAVVSMIEKSRPTQ